MPRLPDDASRRDTFQARKLPQAVRERRRCAELHNKLNDDVDKVETGEMSVKEANKIIKEISKAIKATEKRLKESRRARSACRARGAGWDARGRGHQRTQKNLQLFGLRGFLFIFAVVMNRSASAFPERHGR